ncbi:PREDICTED: G-type lectin S-receptor-like serine/threonine-protein kinase SD2-5 [Nelumbo nucifera]|uniref:Receptor-like serine/threonine-protein kinase n=2 Tax=Nelumbo nucifera TaxID=4432 RepID=A0A1U7Z4C3_NELNU|nr:PREDICTED: G-type lectin S-receptor-like serine/threonine-protein kinase SD2-5 [Nelumbo nucifera]DAD37779.1 TPA_asm: hypothetical protein HUJ06_008420 [Nelumbo nucifera]
MDISKIMGCLLFLLFSSCYLINGQALDNSTANLNSSWTNITSNAHSVVYDSGYKVLVSPILITGIDQNPRFACGFYCNGNCTSFLFAVLVVPIDNVTGMAILEESEPVWSANRDKPVGANATLNLTADGDLILRDFDDSLVWSTNTAGKPVVGLKMTKIGNLVLFDKTNRTIWQSFDHPTDTLVPGQKMVAGQRLTASVSWTNWSRGLFSISVTSEGIFAFVESDPPQVYFQHSLPGKLSYVIFSKGGITMYSSEKNETRVSPPASRLRFTPDGFLSAWDWLDGWQPVKDVLTDKMDLGICGYPTICGNYGLCSYGQCSCPKGTDGEASYFTPLEETQPNKGCSEITPLSCLPSSQSHIFLKLNDVTYFTNAAYCPDITDTSMESCKQSCLKNCSCKAAFFQYYENASIGNCSLPAKLFSLMANNKQITNYSAFAFIKVQKSSSKKKRSQIAITLGSSLGAFFLVLLGFSIWVILYRNIRDADEGEEDDLHHVPGMPMRFSYEELKDMTENFSRKVGEGGFGSVYEGTLGDGTKVAVKCLEGLGEVKKSFLAEVETIGSIHHVNLVRLIGYCSEKSHRLLVYEYMCNGSLDKWIFNQKQEFSLGWQTRLNIIFDIAKGLAYLHEECRQRIIHLDIKPQNILLDENFNAKVSDFGLSKLIDRNQSQVVTTMRGTPGYLAPEWLSSVITEKVDVYSFGVVVMEILCGRKNLDHSQPKDGIHLIGQFKRKAEEGKLADMIDKHSEDMQLHGEEVVEMMRLAAWCLQIDFTRRPSMSVVVKVLEGVMDVEPNLDYSFSSALPVAAAEVTRSYMPSVLSGPR